MKDDIKAFLSEQNVSWEEVDDLRAVASDVDVLYQTRCATSIPSIPDIMCLPW